MKKYSFGNKYIISLLLAITLLITACQSKNFLNFTTYFNTFYNADRLMKEAEEEFDFQKEKKRIQPKVIAPQTNIPEIDKAADNMAPTFLSDIIVSKAVRQSVEVKLDSILIKGSKILAKSAKSDYIEQTLYLMAKTYFYKEEWIPAQIKCSELIDLNPTGDLSPDAHLLMSFTLLLQKKYLSGKTMLSRTVDVAWLKNRYDILTKAFNMEAEMALLENDLEGAVRPYFQAITQSSDNKIKAIWQCEMAHILFRMGKFERAKNAYAKVMEFSPDYVTEYESKLYYASCLIRLNDNYNAEKILNKLDNDGKFTEWKDYVFAQRMLATRLAKDSLELPIMERKADSLYPSSQAKNAYYFEKGLEEYMNSEYISARKSIAIARFTPKQIAVPANKLFDFLNHWELAQKTINLNKLMIEKGNNTNNENEKTITLDTNNTVNQIIIDENTKEQIANNNNQTNLNEVKSEQNQENQIKIIDNSNLNKITISKDNLESSKQQVKPINQKFVKFTVEPHRDLNALQDTIQITDTDVLKAEMAKSYFTLARLHHNIGNKDSANYYYHQAAMEAPLTSEVSAHYLYVYSTSIRDTNEQKADSILDLIVATQPKTEHGRAAMAELGYTAAFIMDTATALYNSGFDLMKHEEYEFAIKQFNKVYTNYPQNLDYAPKSLYSVGFIFEQKLLNYDSAYYYYQKLIEEYPNSIYAKELELPVKYLALIKSGEAIPDELKERKVKQYHANREILTAPIDSSLLLTPKKDSEGFEWKDLKDPKKLLNKVKKGVQDNINKIGDFETIKNQLLEQVDPEKLVPKLEDFVPGEKDTTNQQLILPPEPKK